MNATEPLGQRVLKALEQRLIVTPSLRYKLVALGSRPVADELEAISSDLASYVLMGAGARAATLLVELEAASGGNLSLLPRDAAVEVDEDARSVVRSRTRAGELALKIGFTAMERTKIATAVSELARNIHLYARRGTIELRVLPQPSRGLSIIARDQGPGIPDVSAILGGSYRSRTGMGLGLRGVQRVAKDFRIVSSPETGTEVTVVFLVSKF